MRKIILFLLILLANNLYAQDSITHKGMTYIALSPDFYKSGTGGGEITASGGELITADIEIGRQWDAFALGIDIGKTNFGNPNTLDNIHGVIPSGKWYVEFRPNLNVFQQGKFTNTITIGFGYVFNSYQNTMVEARTGIEYDFSPRIAYNVNYGYFSFNGKRLSSNQTFFGFSIMYAFVKTKH